MGLRRAERRWAAAEAAVGVAGGYFGMAGGGGGGWPALEALAAFQPALAAAAARWEREQLSSTCHTRSMRVHCRSAPSTVRRPRQGHGRRDTEADPDPGPPRLGSQGVRATVLSFPSASRRVSILPTAFCSLPAVSLMRAHCDNVHCTASRCSSGSHPPSSSRLLEVRTTVFLSLPFPAFPQRGLWPPADEAAVGGLVNCRDGM